MVKDRVKPKIVILIIVNMLIIGCLESSGNIHFVMDSSDVSIESYQAKGRTSSINSEVTFFSDSDVQMRSEVFATSTYIEHGTISINGNNDFNNTATTEGWLGNGSIDNPFIIEGLNITASTTVTLVQIQNTDVYFQINDSLLVGESYGIYLRNVDHGVIANNTFISNNPGIFLEMAENNTIYNNTFSDCTTGIQIYDLACNNTILNNTIVDARYGIYSYFGSNSIMNNVFTNCGIYLTGSRVIDYVQNEVANNIVNGKPLLYWQDITGGIIPTDVGQIILVNCNSIKVTGLNISNCSVGLLAAFCNDLIISDNSISYNQFGIRLAYLLTNCTVSNNTVFNNVFGISLYYCEKTSLSFNILSGNSQGFRIDYSIDNVFFDNYAFSNSIAAYYLTYAEYNKFYRNKISNSPQNGFNLVYSSSNDLYGNTIANLGKYGIYFRYSYNNIIQWNDFINNNPSGTSQGYDEKNIDIPNIIEYNYWNDWITPDINSDNIVDSPYLIDGDSNSQDSHPLTTPVHLSLPSVIFPNGGNTLNGIVTIEWSPAIDQWGHTVNYTVYYSSDSGNTWLTLASSLAATSYQWDTTTVPEGIEYLVKVVATCTVGLSAEDVSDSIFTIQNTVVIPPSVPQALTATAGEMFVYLTWIAPGSDGGSAITGYRVYRGTSSGEFSLSFFTSDTDYNDTLVTGDTAYYYVVTAVNSIGESLSSDEVLGTPFLPPTPTLTSTIIIETSIIYQTTWVTQTKSTAEFATLAILAGFLGVLWLKRRRKK